MDILSEIDKSITHANETLIDYDKALTEISLNIKAINKNLENIKQSINN